MGTSEIRVVSSFGYHLESESRIYIRLSLCIVHVCTYVAACQACQKFYSNCEYIKIYIA